MSEKMKDNNHRKKMVAPIIITVVFVAYLTFYGVAVWISSGFSPLTLLLAIPLVALGIGMVYVLHSRIREIRSGEEDDLSDY